MFRIALCDDNVYNMKEVESALITILFDRTEFDISTYRDGVEVVEAISNNNFSADLIFLDINMPKINGLKVAEFIRKNNLDCDIIFLTGDREYVLDGYKYNAFDYLIKPVSVSKLQKTIDRYISRSEKINTFFYFKSQNNYLRVNVNKVEAFAGSGRKVTVMAEGTQISFYKKIDEVEASLSIYKNFIRPHQSFIVNMDHIIQFTNNKIVMESGLEVPIAKNRYHQVREFFKTYIRFDTI